MRKIRFLQSYDSAMLGKGIIEHNQVQMLIPRGLTNNSKIDRKFFIYISCLLEFDVIKRI